MPDNYELLELMTHVYTGPGEYLMPEQDPARRGELAGLELLLMLPLVALHYGKAREVDDVVTQVFTPQFRFEMQIFARTVIEYAQYKGMARVGTGVVREVMSRWGQLRLESPRKSSAPQTPDVLVHSLLQQLRPLSRDIGQGIPAPKSEPAKKRKPRKKNK